MKHIGASVVADTLISCYGQPQRSKLAKRTKGAKLASDVVLSPATDDQNNLALTRCSSAPTVDRRTSVGAIVLLGPRARSNSQHIVDGLRSNSPHNMDGTSVSICSSPASPPPSRKSDHRNLSLTEIKCIAHTTKPSKANPVVNPVAESSSLGRSYLAPSSLALTDNAICHEIATAKEPRCVACAGGFYVSNAFPHGPDGYTDRTRCRDKPRPSSQPDSPTFLATVADGLLRPNTADAILNMKGKRRRARTSSARASSVERFSNDGSCSYDAYDYVEIDPDEALAKSPLGATWAGKAHKNDIKKANPFIEFETREQRLIQERRWLMEADGNYMLERKKDLRHNRVQNHIDLHSWSADELFERRTMYGPYAMDMKEQKYGKRNLIKPKSETKAGKKRNAGKKGADAVEIYPDPAIMEFKEARKGLETSMKPHGYTPSYDNSPRKEVKSLKSGISETADLFRQAFQVHSNSEERASLI